MPVDYKALRDECRRAGVPFEELRDVKNTLQQLEREKRTRANEIRATAWMIHKASTPGCWPFWRHGFRADWLRRVDESDHTIIPGYDEIHQQIAWHFPEYDTPDGEERLFEFLLSPYDRMPPAADLWWEAFERIVDDRGKGDVSFAFGANLTNEDF